MFIANEAAIGMHVKFVQWYQRKVKIEYSLYVWQMCRYNRHERYTDTLKCSGGPLEVGDNLSYLGYNLAVEKGVLKVQLLG